MRGYSVFLLIFIFIGFASCNNNNNTNGNGLRFIVVMLENQSFSRIFGYFKGTTSHLNGSEYNLNSNGNKIFISNATSYCPFCDPDHNIGATKVNLLPINIYVSFHSYIQHM